MLTQDAAPPEAPEITPEPQAAPPLPWQERPNVQVTPAKRKKVVVIGTPHTGTFTVEYVASLANTLIKGRHDFRHMFMEGSVIYHGRNLIATSLPPDADFLLFIDADMGWSPEAVDRLVAADKDIIAALAYARTYPFRPTVFNDDGSLPEIPPHPFRVDMVGAAFMLIKADVLMTFKLLRPKYGLPFDPVFQPLGERSNFSFEDLGFCKKARDMGLEVWCDPTLEILHVGKTLHATQGYLRQGFVGFRAPPPGFLVDGMSNG